MKEQAYIDEYSEFTEEDRKVLLARLEKIENRFPEYQQWIIDAEKEGYVFTGALCGESK